MKRRVLIACDGSPDGEWVLEDLSSASLGDEVEAEVVTVADVWLPSNPGRAEIEEPFPPADTPAIRQARVHAEHELSRAGAAAARAAESLRARFPKWQVSSFSCADSPSWGILSRAAAWKASLVVLGSHGRSTLERFFLGSVSQKVAAEAACSVRIARPASSASRAHRRIVVAVDGSADSENAVREVAGRSWPAGCEFRIVAVIDPRLESALAWPEAFRPGWNRGATEGGRDAIARMMEQDAKWLYDRGLPVETSILTGDAKRELLSHARNWEADTIFVGARGVHHGGRLSLGTTVSAVTARAHCSVEIVRANAG